MTLIDRFKMIRNTLGLTQKEFGKALNKTYIMIQNYEKGRRNITDGVLLNLQDIFNVNIEWMRTGEGSMFLDEKKEESVNIANLPAPNYELPASFLELCCKLKKEDLIRVEGYIQAIVDSYKNKDMQKLSS